MALVKLEEPRGAGTVGFGNVFYGAAAGGRESVREVELVCDFRDGDLSCRVVDTIDADRGETDWRGDLVAKDGRPRITRVGVHQHPRDDAVPIKCLAIGKMRPGVPSVA